MSDYEYQVAYHKGAFAALLNLKNVIEHFKNGPHTKLIPKKVYKLLLSYLDVALHNIDEFMDYGGVRYIIIDKDNNCQRVSEQEALNFISENRKKYEEKKRRRLVKSRLEYYNILKLHIQQENFTNE